MQISTQWQTAYYTPPAPVAKPPPRIRRERPERSNGVRRAYLVFGRSKTAQRVYNTIKTHDGLTVMDLIEKTKLIGVGHYIKTLCEDEMLISKPLRLPHANQAVRHYWAAP